MVRAIAQDIAEADELLSAIARYTERFPSSTYQPHSRGQLQFHLAEQMIRGLFPGNGFGKTRAMAEEFNDLCTQRGRWGYRLTWPARCIWWCQNYDQFEMLKIQIEGETIGDQAVWNSKHHRYDYPNGSQWYVVSCERKWTKVQGIPMDLVGFDEQPPLQLYREMLVRRRGKRKTRYIFAATATQGLTWMRGEVYEPWLKHHEALHIGETEALAEQAHPRIWCWPAGGIDDNPGADASDREHYHAMTWSSEKEKKVRLYGGFEDWTGDPVFNPEAIEAIRQRIRDRLSLPGRRGMLVATRHEKAA